MASRLSDDQIRAAYDGGQQAFAIEARRPAHRSRVLAPAEDAVDLDALVAREDATAAVQAVPPQTLYRAIQLRGAEDCLEVLPHLSTEQVIRIFDYDCWQGDKLAPARVGRWIALWKEVGDEELYKRFRDLDEEYQLAYLCPLIELFDEEQYETMGQADQDSLTRLPCNTLYYRLKSDDPRVEEQVGWLVEATLASDVNYAYALLAHASYMPPNESEGQLAQFRRARLEEDGFLSYEESLEDFRPLDLDELVQRYGGRAGATREDRAALVPAARPDGPGFLAEALERTLQTVSAEEHDTLAMGFTALANALCAACKVETDDVSGQRRLLTLSQAASSLGLELVSGGDLDRAALVLKSEHPQRLFRAGLAVARQVAEEVAERLEQAGVPGLEPVRRLHALDRRGALLHHLDVALLPVLGFERVELLKGLFNRFPLAPRLGRKAESAVDAERRIVFEPVQSLAELAALRTAADAVSAAAWLARQALGERPWSGSLDEILATAVTRALGGGAFDATPLTADDLAKVAALEHAATQALVSDLCAEVEERLRAQRAAWATGPVDAGVPAAMAAFADVVMDALAARERAGRMDGALAAWAGVVLVRASEQRSEANDA